MFLPAGAEKLSVAKNQHFAHSGKKYELDRKMVNTFHDGHDEVYHHVKFGGDRTTHALEFVTHFRNRRFTRIKGKN